MASASRAPRSPHRHGPSEIWRRRHVVAELSAIAGGLAVRLKALRVARGVSQERAAELIGVHAKYLQRLESGRANPALGTLVAVAIAYGVRVESLFEAAQSDPTERSPFHVVPPDSARPFRDALPLYPLRVAAGAFGAAGTAVVPPAPEAWVVPHGRRRPAPGMFVAQVHGRSMSRRVPNGAFCLFRTAVPSDREGRTLLVRHRDLHDADLAGDFTLKRWRTIKGKRTGGVRLDPDSDVTGYEPIELVGEAAAALDVIAELIEVLPGAAP